MENIRKTIRYFFASLLLLSPLAVYPLAWSRLVRDEGPFWDNLTLVDNGIIGLIAGAAIIAVPERLWSSIRNDKLVRWSILAVLAGIVTALIQQSLYGGPPRLFIDALFQLLLPVAGIALAAELKRLLPFYCSGLFFLLLAATIQSSFCVGFVGNWNWNFTLLAITLPALFFWRGASCLRLLFAGGAVVAGVVGIFIAFPEIAPRGTAAGLIGSIALLGLLFMLPRKQRWIYGILIMAGSFALFVSTLNAPDTANIRDSRIQLWRGSLEFTLAHAAFGVGPARFESRIPPFLPSRYFLTDFPATRHPHPHNEMLYAWGGFGLAGLAILLLFFISAIRRLRLHDPVGVWLGWCLLLLLIHGQFDVLLGTPLAGTLFFLIIGVLSATHLPSPASPCLSFRAILALLLLISAAVMGVNNFRSGSALRNGRMLLADGDKQGALKEFLRSDAIRPTPETLYLAGAVELFDHKNPRAALLWLNRIETEWGFPSYLHTNNRIARAHAVLGNLPVALEYFNRERNDFPFSAINAGMRLSILKQLNASPPVVEAAQKEFVSNMEMRHLKPDEFGTIMKNQALDDEPFVQKK